MFLLPVPIYVLHEEPPPYSVKRAAYNVQLLGLIGMTSPETNRPLYNRLQHSGFCSHRHMHRQLFSSQGKIEVLQVVQALDLF